MHVVMVNHGYRPLPPEAADSPALVIDQLASALVRRGVRVTAIGGPAVARSTSYETRELRPSKVARGGGTPLRELLFGLEVRREVGQLRPDVVHHHASTPAALGCRRRGVPTVLSYAAPIGLDGRVATWGALSPVSEFVEEVACRRVDHVNAVSEFTKRYLRSHYRVPRQRLGVIPNGVDTVLFTPGTAEPIDRVILCVARLSPYKDQATLVAALAQPELTDSGARLVLVGPSDDMSYASSLRRLAKQLGVEDRLELAGPMDFTRLPDVYRSASVVVTPSHAEAAPLALLEAMSSGCAVVASGIPQHLEVGPDAGVTFVPTRDPVAMAKAIAGLINNAEARVHDGEAARRTAVERYSWEAIAERFERLYLGLAG